MMNSKIILTALFSSATVLAGCGGELKPPADPQAAKEATIAATAKIAEALKADIRSYQVITGPYLTSFSNSGIYKGKGRPQPGEYILADNLSSAATEEGYQITFGLGRTPGKIEFNTKIYCKRNGPTPFSCSKPF